MAGCWGSGPNPDSRASAQPAPPLGVSLGVLFQRGGVLLPPPGPPLRCVSVAVGNGLRVHFGLIRVGVGFCRGDSTRVGLGSLVASWVSCIVGSGCGTSSLFTYAGRGNSLTACPLLAVFHVVSPGQGWISATEEGAVTGTGVVVQIAIPVVARDVHHSRRDLSGVRHEPG